MSNFAFNNVPVLRYKRSRFDLSHGVKTSANVGTLYPFDVQEVYAGDTFKVNTSVVSRLSSQFIRPVMDNLFLDIHYFYVPSRLLYDKFVNVFGENTESAWANTSEYAVPVVAEGETIPEKTVGDFLGLPTKVEMPAVSVLPFRAFAKIYDEWFRDQNNVNPMHIQYGEAGATEVPNSNPWAPDNYFGQLPKVAKFHDFFTSLLPQPQKGEAPSISVGTTAPVFADAGAHGHASTPLSWAFRNGSGFTAGTNYDLSIGSTISGDSGSTFANPVSGSLPNVSARVYPSNLYADLSDAGGITVNELRFAFQYQKMLERDARSGTRFVEFLASHFGVQAGDYRLQRSEYLGGKRTPLSIHQVTQTTGSGSDSSPLAEVGAYSLSNARSRFTKSFVENGYVIGVFCIRQHHTYQQGVEPFWFRSKRTDFYDPVFSHIGEQPIYKKSIYVDGAAGTNEQVLGYGEAWVDLRSRFNRITGQMRSNATDTLDVWHFADVYSNAPTLNEQFIEETPDFVDRTITVPSSSMDQFILDIWIQNIAYRVLPTYSVPSLIDHD